MTKIIDVFDKGYVRLVDSMGNDLSIVRAARVSYNSEWREGATSEKSDAKLISYLMKNHHTSPFEHVSLTFEVKAPLFVFRQWHRHRTWSYNEVSARYTRLPEDFYVPGCDKIGVQSTHNKQMREFHDATVDTARARVVLGLIKTQCEDCFISYRALLRAGVPREIARTVLPLATYSKMFATVDLHNLFGFLRLRLHEHAQYEIQVYAQAMLELAKTVAPVACECFVQGL